MRNVFYSSQFKKDIKTVSKRNLDMSLLRTVMKDLENEIPLDAKYKEHPLKGTYVNHLECHVLPNWLLVYQIDDNIKRIIFIRTGSHSDLF